MVLVFSTKPKRTSVLEAHHHRLHQSLHDITIAPSEFQDGDSYKLRVISKSAVVRATCRRLMGAPPARVGDDVVRIGWDLLEDGSGEQMLNLGDAQVDARQAGRCPFFRGDCRGRMAARKACA
jgi:hypothetical protein